LTTAQEGGKVVSHTHRPWKLLATCQNNHNWKCPGSDQIQNYWIKAFPATHRQIAKNFNATIEEPEKAPD